MQIITTIKEKLLPDGKNREFVPDLMRTIAVLTAIATHSLQQDISQGIITASGTVYRCTLAYIVFLVCNPIYVMLSGALLLKWKDEKLSAFYFRRVRRVIVPMILYYVWYVYVNHARGTVVDAAYLWEHIVKNLLTGSTGESPHYWLMYIILSLYVVFPFFRWMFKDMPYHVLTAFSAVILLMMGINTFLPAIGLPLALNSFLSGWYGIAILGFWVTQNETRHYDRMLIGLGVLTLPVMAWIVSVRADAVALLANVSPIAALFAMSLFSLSYLLFDSKKKQTEDGAAEEKAGSISGIGRISDILSGIVRLISRHSFGILLIHWYVLHRIVRDRLHFTSAIGGGGDIGAVAGTLLAVAATCGISFVIAFFMDRTVIHWLTGEWKKKK